MTALEHPAVELLSDYALGQLPPADLDFVAEHIEQCAACRETLMTLPSEDTLVRGLAAASVESAYADEPELAAALARLSETNEPAADSTAALGVLRDYQLLSKLGQGGMGAVYRARHERLGRLVAVKVLPQERMRQPEAILRFAREMQAIGNLDHPNIVRAFDAGEVEGKHFLVMELIDGVDLSSLVVRQGPLRIADACELVRQAAIGLQYAHDQGLVHRDVKPSNLMLDCHGRVKVLDLGLARLLNDGCSDSPVSLSDTGSAGGDLCRQTPAGLTATDQVMGTPDYMAPEQCTGSRAVDGRSDVYSLGATLFKLLAGHSPYSGSEYDTLAKKINGLLEHPLPSIARHRQDLPPKLIEVLERMLAKDPAERIATPAAVAFALEPFAVGHRLDLLKGQAASGDEAATASLGAAPPREPGRWRWIVAAGFSFVLLAAVLLKLKTPAGELTVEVPDEYRDQVQVEVRQAGQVEVLSAQQGWHAKLADGTWDVALTDPKDQFKLDRDKVTITRGEKQLVRILLKRTPELNLRRNNTQAADEVALRRRHESLTDVSLFTQEYVRGRAPEDRSIVYLEKNLELRVMPKYKNGGEVGSAIDSRLTLILSDKEKNLWPMIAKLSGGAVKSLRMRLSNAIRILKSQHIGINDSKKLVAFLAIDEGNTDAEGRVELPRGLQVDIEKRNGTPDSEPIVILKFSDHRSGKSPVVAEMSLSVAERFSQDLAEAIEVRKRLDKHVTTRPASHVLARFTPGEEKPISDYHIAAFPNFGKSWIFQAPGATTFRLFEINNPEKLEDCVVTFRARMKTKDVEGKAYLEMWCRVPPDPEAFSKGYHHAVSGTNDWATYETPFFLEKGEHCDLIKLNVVTEGRGTIYLKDVEVIVSPMHQDLETERAAKESNS